MNLNDLETRSSWNGREEYKCPKCGFFYHPINFSDESLDLGMCDSCLEKIKYRVMVDSAPRVFCEKCGKETPHLPSERRQKWGVIYGSRCTSCNTFYSDGELDINKHHLPRHKITREQMIRYMEEDE